jgi:hypothetical protein
MPLYTLSMIKADRCNNAITDGGHLLTRALNGLCFAACSRSLPPPQPGCPSGDPGSLPVPYSSTHVAELFSDAGARAFCAPYSANPARSRAKFCSAVMRSKNDLGKLTRPKTSISGAATDDTGSMEPICTLLRRDFCFRSLVTRGLGG